MKRVPASRAALRAFALGAALPIAVTASCGGDAAPAGEPVGPRIVVAPFENRTGADSLDAFGDAAASWIARGLAMAGADVVPYISVAAHTTGGARPGSPTAAASPGEHRDLASAADSVARARGDVAVARASRDIAPAKDDLADAVGARILVTGSYRLDGGQIAVDARVLGVETGTAVDVEPVREPADAPTQALDRARAAVAGAIAALADSTAAVRLRAEALRPGDAPPLDAIVDYTAGIAAYVRQDFATAADRLERAARADFAAPLIWAALARSALGAYAAADSLVALAAGQPDALTPVERHGAEYVAARLRGDHAAALEASRAAASLAPGSIWTYYAAVAALGANRPAEAERLLESVDPNQGGLRGWLPYWALLAEARHLTGQHEQELELARRARSLDPADLGLLQLEVRARAALGQGEAVDSLLREAASLETTIRGAGAIAPVTVMITAGRELRAHGVPAFADSAFARALAWQRGRPREEQLSLGGLEFLGRTYYTMGDYEQAASVYRSFLPAMLIGGMTQAMERGEELRFARALPPAAQDRFTQTMFSVRAALAAHAGEMPMADRIDRILAYLDDPYHRRYILAARARVAAAAGNDARAVELLRQAIDAGFVAADLHADPEFDALRDFAPYRELVEPEG